MHFRYRLNGLGLLDVAEVKVARNVSRRENVCRLGRRDKKMKGCVQGVTE